eukprot:m.8030 g.8030  ORF g.8030 m.8030 type:complete len:685 (-) comp5156_c0_seq2:41-2095(-)
MLRMRILLLVALAAIVGVFGEDLHDGALPPFPLDPVVQQARAAAAAARKPKPTGITSHDYLVEIAGTVEVFVQFQNMNASSPSYGKIIDPYAKIEIQYATPCFANAAALLVRENYYSGDFAQELLQRASLAMEAALTALVFGQPKGDQGCAQGHCNFYTMPLMFAFESFLNLVPDATLQRWRSLLSQVNATRAYSHWPHQAGNWAIVALTGEALRYLHGLRPDGTEDIETQLGFQFTDYYWTDNGEYQDHSGCAGACSPMPYDHFPRKYIAVMLAKGFLPVNQSAYWDLVTRGAWTSLLLQSPWGELPTGARSSQHQWNEAVSCVTYELFAARLQSQGDSDGASLFKRASALSLLSLRRWKNEAGAWFIVKNRFSPALRHGYEGYSYYSQYNLLPASMLATAYLFADDGIEEKASFAETGGFVFTIDNMHKVVANAGGYYVEIELFPDTPTHDVLGLSRMHTPAADPLVTGTAGAPLAPETGSFIDAGKFVEPTARATNPSATGFGAAWETKTGWQRLGQFTFTDVVNTSLDVTQSTVDNALFTVTYLLGAKSVVEVVEEKYNVTSAGVHVTVQLHARVGHTITRAALMYPALTFDGQRNTTLTLDRSSNSARVSLPGDARSGLGVTCGVARVVKGCDGGSGGGIEWATSEEGTYTRNGFATIVHASFAYTPGCAFEYVFSAGC